MLATAIDLGLLFMIALPVVDAITRHLFAPVNASAFLTVLNSPDIHSNPPRFIRELWQVMKEQHAIQRLVVQNLMQIICIALYIMPFWFHFSSTPGKNAFPTRDPRQ